MSARVTAVALALVIGLVPGTLEAGEPEPRPGEPASPSSPSTTGPADSPLLRLEWLDVSGVAPGVGGVARAEVQEILEEAGVDLVWLRSCKREESRSVEIRVILDDQLKFDRMSRGPVLGATPVSFREHPFVWIHVPAVRASLGLAPRAPVRPLELRRRRDLGVALGRVIAHEVVHALAPSVPHGGELMSERLTHHQLTAARLAFHPGVTRAVRERLHR